MNWKGHLSVTTLLFAAVFLVSTYVFPAAGILPKSIFMLAGLFVIALASTLVPDLDHPDSKGTQVMDKVFPIAMFAIAGTSTFKDPKLSPDYLLPRLQPFFIFALAGIGLFYILKTYFRPSHRGITHTLFANAVYAALAFLLTGDVYITGAAGFGYFSHLLADKQIKLI